MQWNYKV